MNAREFLTELYRGVQPGKVTYLFTCPDHATYPYTIAQTEEMLERAMALSQTRDVYFGLHLMDEPPPRGGRASRDRIRCISFLHGEFDVKGPAHKEEKLPETLDELLDFLHVLECPPSIAVSISGNASGLTVLLAAAA